MHLFLEHDFLFVNVLQGFYFISIEKPNLFK
jgi:hypothetical protein